MSHNVAQRRSTSYNVVQRRTTSYNVGWTNGRVDTQTDGRMDGQTAAYVLYKFAKSHNVDGTEKLVLLEDFSGFSSSYTVAVGARADPLPYAF